ncbi:MULTISPECIES: acyltransferase family protein [Bacillaceae]|uniref:acyltransferase family protein n=1 Tax=Bacillaceae TaxID=186817 RepID=UPI0011A97A1A|nr:MULTISPECIES: acyltransferase family protein [Bacillaceae]MED4473921.1 acyltransferase family protein [Oceanobacillus caeni]
MERNAFIDNAKVLFIFLVVFGHMIQPFTSDSRGVETLYLWIYTFHMPAFIMVSGFFAKGSSDKGYLWKLIKKLLVPYFIFQGIYTLFYFSVGSGSWKTGVFQPQWSLWFLLSLLCWHLLLIVYKRWPAKIGIPLSVIIGLIAGYFSEIGHTFSLSRTLVFFPFFLLGFHLTQKQLLFVKRPVAKIASVFVMIAVAVFLYYIPNIDSGWFLQSKPYDDLDAGQYSAAIRLSVYITAAFMTASILAWVPERNLNWVTELGKRTLYVYLLHGFFIQTFRHYDLFQMNSFISFIEMLVLSILIVILLSSKPIIAITQPIVEGKVNLLKQWGRRDKQSQSYHV